MTPLAIVIPWFGPNLAGGAEQQAFQIATRLALRGHAVDVLTTCNRSFDSDWAMNHYPEGATEEFNLTIRRFAVDPRAAVEFDRVNAKLLSYPRHGLRRGVSPVSLAETETFAHENIKSSSLLKYLDSNGHVYGHLIFLPYMFGPVTLGLPLVAERAWLQPCLHDEPQAYFPQTAKMFRAAKGLLFNSEGEFELALGLYGPGIYTRSQVIGEGVEYTHHEPDVLTAALPDRLRGERFLLYLGRRERGKNVDLLVEAFAQFKNSQRSRLKLVLAGTGSESISPNKSITEMEFVAGEQKAALLSSCLALIQPSVNESFSRVLMEAWAAGRPAAVNGSCLATSIAVKKARGGWTATTLEQWIELFKYLDSESDEVLSEIGQRGREYVEINANWDTVIDRYEKILGLKNRLRARSEVKTQPRRSIESIHQLLPDFVYGDAISNQATAIRDHLRQSGYTSEIFCKRRAERLAGEAVLLEETQPASDSGLIYHHAIGSDAAAIGMAHPGPKALIYHNITPGKYYGPYRPAFAWMLELGRANLKRLARHFPVSVGDSAYNAAELAANGFREPHVLPIIIDPDKWNIEPASPLMARLQDGRTNLLFVGRIAPNKKQDRLVEAFAHYRELNPKARLIIVGEARASDPYFHELRQRCIELKLENDVELSGQIDDGELLAYYQIAHLYWSASEHEGFGAPLVEAMWFDIPVLALNESAVPETLGRAGMLYDNDESLPQVATRAYQLTHDEAKRHEIIQEQRLRRLDFTPEAVAPRIERLCELLEANRDVLEGVNSKLEDR